MKNTKISSLLVFFSLGFWATIGAETPQPKEPKPIKTLFAERDLRALSWWFQQNTPNIDEASIDGKTPLIIACGNLDVGMVGFLLNNIQNANPNLFNPLGITLRTILAQHTEPSKTPPTTLEIPEFPKAKAIEEVLDTLIKCGANPLTYKDENLQLLDKLIKAREAIAYSSPRNPIFIALRKILPAFLVYEVSEPIDTPQKKGMPKYGDTKLIDTYLQPINNLYEKFPQTFDPLNTPLVEKGDGILGKTPIQLAAENGHAGYLKAMLALKNSRGHARVSFATAHTALRTAQQKNPDLFAKEQSCKEILEDYLRTHFLLNKEHSERIIQTAQSIAARITWQQRDLKTDTYDNAITHAISKYTEKRFTGD